MYLYLQDNQDSYDQHLRLSKQIERCNVKEANISYLIRLIFRKGREKKTKIMRDRVR